MEEYDVVVVCGGEAGSVAARFAAKYGFKCVRFQLGHGGLHTVYLRFPIL